jgi:hypothetical protein
MVRPVGLPFLLCAAVLVAGSGAQTLDARSAATSLRLVLTAAPSLGTSGRAALIREASRIWNQAGVHVEWIAPVAPIPLPRNTLRVLAVSRSASPAGAHVWVLGELLRFEGSKAIARLSLPDAERIITRARVPAGSAADERVGIVLGRAAAHEIGHYLLDTSTHAQSGLMRAAFDEWEFAEPRSGAFDLDEHATAWVRQRIEAGLPLGPASAGGAAAAYASLHVRFSYRQ